MLKRIVIAAVAAAACIMPVQAEVQRGTSRLIETLEDSGVVVTVNPRSCKTDSAAGSYRWVGFQREITLCVGRSFDAGDHDTVRHETVHAIQHCVNAARRTSTDNPIIDDPDTFINFIEENLTPNEIEWIKSVYRESQWLTELEAFAGAKAYTSSELEALFLEACTLQESFDG